MGKNQQHKAMQRGRGAGDEAPEAGSEDPGTDVTFHTAEWHAARISALTTERMSWDDWKKQQKEIKNKEEQALEEEEAKMREYRAQLDADRNARLSKGVNNAHFRVQKNGNSKSEKDHKKKKHKKRSKDNKASKSDKKRRKHRHSSSESSSDSESRDSREKRKKRKKREKDLGDEEGNNEPLRLSEYLNAS